MGKMVLIFSLHFYNVYIMKCILSHITAIQMPCCVLEGQIINGSSLVAKWQDKFMITDLPHHYHKVLSKISS